MITGAPEHVIASTSTSSAPTANTARLRSVSASGLLRLWRHRGFARDHRELRGGDLERLPSLSVPLIVGRDHLVGERARRLVLRDHPRAGPEKVGRRYPRRVWLEFQLNRFAIRKFDHQALEAFVVDLVAIGVQHAHAPSHLLLAEELALQHTERPGLTRLRALHQIAFEEQLARLLTLRWDREADSCEQREQ